MGYSQSVRIEGWEKRLAQYLESATARPFAWGQHDCCLWAAGWVEECSGIDYTSEWIGQYGTEEEALALAHSRGFANYADIADAHLEVKPMMLAQRGDLVLRKGGALGICNGRLSYFIAPDGIITEETLGCVRAWKV